jgi:hypothetical protein
VSKTESELIKAERDVLLDFIGSLDERLLVNRLDGERRRHHEILYFVKSRIFDTQQALKAVRNRHDTVAD